MANDFKKYILSRTYLEKIREYSDKRPILKGSHRGQMANYIGYIGVYYFKEWVDFLGKSDRILKSGISNLSAKIIDIVNYDVLVNFDYSGKVYSFRVEVKIKDRNVVPRSDYEVSIPVNTYQYQVPDYYFALSLERGRSDIIDSFQNIYFLRFISRGGYDVNKYKEVAGKKSNGADFFCDTWNIKIRVLEEATNFPLGMIKVEEEPVEIMEKEEIQETLFDIL
jgi:hypothetical protein